MPGPPRDGTPRCDESPVLRWRLDDLYTLHLLGKCNRENLPGGMSDDNIVTVQTPHIDITLSMFDVLRQE